MTPTNLPDIIRTLLFLYPTAWITLCLLINSASPQKVWPPNWKDPPVHLANWLFPLDTGEELVCYKQDQVNFDKPSSNENPYFTKLIEWPGPKPTISPWRAPQHRILRRQPWSQQHLQRSTNRQPSLDPNTRQRWHHRTRLRVPKPLSCPGRPMGCNLLGPVSRLYTFMISFMLF